MTADDAYQLYAKRHDFHLPWSPKEADMKDAFMAGWAAHEESLRQTTMALDDAPDAYEGQIALSVYAEYPRKVGKRAALKAIEKALKDVGPEVLMEATRSYARHVATWPAADKQFIPFPATWYNRGSYADDRKEWLRGGAAVPSQFTHQR